MEMSVIDHQRRASVSTGGAAAMGEPLVMIGQATSIASESGTGGTVTAIGMIPSAQNGNVPKPDIDNMNEARRRPSVQFQSPEPRVLLERIPTYLQPSLPWHDRLMHFTFAWYTVTMSTSGIALIIAQTPHRFTGLSTIGLIIFILDLVAFLLITIAIVLRFVLYRRTFRRAFTHPSEALFVSTFFLSIAAILVNVEEYGALFLSTTTTTTTTRPALSTFLRVAFWTYLATTFAFSVFQYHLLFTVKPERRLTVNAMTPAWILPIFPVMLAGTLAGSFSKTQPPAFALSMISAGLAAQGLGILVSVFFYATYLSRLMAFGLPVQRPGMFIAVGPPSFTCAALVAMAADVPRIFASAGLAEVSILAGLGAPDTLAAGVRLLAISTAVFFWGLSFWFFASAVAAVVAGMPDRTFHLSWWSFVFPNVGFVSASIRMGVAFGSEGLLWLSSVMTVCLVAAWGFIVFRCIRAVCKREIVWPGHDEDTD